MQFDLYLNISTMRLCSFLKDLKSFIFFHLEGSMCISITILLMESRLVPLFSVPSSSILRGISGAIYTCKKGGHQPPLRCLSQQKGWRRRKRKYDS